MILKIAKAELRTLFYSPIAWLIIIAFYVLCGYQFVNPLVDFARVQEANIKHNPNYLFGKAISVAIFVKSIQNVLENLYLFIPLLTMGVINREASSGSLKLLYSSPIRTRDIVLGKYIGLMVFNLILVLIVLLLFTTGCFTIVNAEFSWYLSIVLAIFLLANAYVAIGVFMSSLTNYQLVAAILTFMVFFVLQYIGDYWQDYDFFRDLTYFLTMTNKANLMIGGLITSRDVLYFLLITATFLAFAIIRMKSTQESKSWKVSFFRYAGVFAVMLMLGYFSSRPGYVAYVDVTRQKVNTIHPNVQEVLKKLDGSPLTVTLYTNLLSKGALFGFPRSRNNYVWNYWEMFGRSYPNINLKYEYYYDDSETNPQMLQHFKGKTIHQAALMYANLLKADMNLFKKPEEMRKQIDLSGENYRLILELEYKGRKAFARTYDDQIVIPGQEHIAASVLQLIDTIPKVVFTTGHFERSPNSNGERGYAKVFNDKLHRLALINNGVATDTISLVEKDIPEQTAVLVVADPKTSYSELEKDKIVSYLRNGGNAFILGEPGKQSILNELLTETGVKMDDGVIVQTQHSNTPDYLLVLLTHVGHYMSDVQVMYNYRNQGRITGMPAYTAANLSYTYTNGFKVEPIYEFTPTGNAWLENGVYVSDSAAPIFSPSEGDVSRKRFIVGVQLTRTINNKEQRIVISGDADNFSNRNSMGFDIAGGTMSWLLYNKYPVYIPLDPPIDRKVSISFDGSRVLYIAYVYVVPGLLLLVGMMLLIRRKRK